MLPAKYQNGQSVLAIPAYTGKRERTNDESLSNTRIKAITDIKLKPKSRIEELIELCGA